MFTEIFTYHYEIIQFIKLIKRNIFFNAIDIGAFQNIYDINYNEITIIFPTIIEINPIDPFCKIFKFQNISLLYTLGLI